MVKTERKTETKENREQELCDAFWDSEIKPLLPGEADFSKNDVPKNKTKGF
jgi:hypothetical protein